MVSSDLVITSELTRYYQASHGKRTPSSVSVAFGGQSARVVVRLSPDPTSLIDMRAVNLMVSVGFHADSTPTVRSLSHGPACPFSDAVGVQQTELEMETDQVRDNGICRGATRDMTTSTYCRAWHGMASHRIVSIKMRTHVSSTLFFFFLDDDDQCSVRVKGEM